MKKTIPFIVLIIIVVAVAIFAMQKNLKPKENNPQPTSTPSTTPVVENQDGKLLFGAKVYSLSYAQIGSADWPTVQNELELLKAMGVRYYTIHLNYGPWVNNQPGKIAIVDKAVEWIRANGGVLHIADASAETWRSNPLTLDQFDSLFKERIKVWTERYHPEYITTIKEPGWYLAFIKNVQSISPNVLISEFETLSPELNSIVKSISPNTKTIYAETTGALIKSGDPSVPLLKEIVKDPNLDIVGLDVYGYKCGEDNYMPYLKDVLDTARNADKKIWITETWGTTAKNMNSCPTDTQTKWAQYISDYAVREKIPVVEWFFTQQFGTNQTPSDIYFGIKKVMDEY